MKTLAIVLAITLCLALAALYALRDTSKPTEPGDSTSVVAVLGPTAASIQGLELQTPQGNASLMASPISGLFALHLPEANASLGKARLLWCDHLAECQVHLSEDVR